MLYMSDIRLFSKVDSRVSTVSLIPAPNVILAAFVPQYKPT